jgi:hypothetical protein
MTKPFENDKTLGYGLLAIAGNCLGIQSSQWSKILGSKIEFDKDLFEMVSKPQFLQKVLSQMSSTQVVFSETKTEKASQPVAPVKEQPAVDFSQFF